jgi:hypothetical protein
LISKFSIFRPFPHVVGLHAPTLSKHSFVESSLKDIRKLLGSDSATAKATLSRHMPSIVLKPCVKPDGRKVCQVTSEWELLETGVALLGGAGGQS